MLDKQSLTQLSSLKTQIRDSKEYAKGVVAGTSGRFGFVRLEDGRDAFLSPEKMDRVLPGDTVKISVQTTGEGKTEGDLESFHGSTVSKFVGQYIVKGAGHFVAPSDAGFHRWIFIPPQQRKQSKNGDFVVAQLTKHPFKDGKAQAKVVFRIGQSDDNYIEHKYIRAKYDLNRKSTSQLDAEAKTIQDTFAKASFGERVDLSDIPFVTIDAATTLDMDDAIACRTLENGNILLHVAISDPASFIDPNSELGKLAQSSAQTVYLLGGTVAMLPKQLSHYCFSLEAEKLRPVLACAIEINPDGSIAEFEFKKALVQSRQKLSYEQVGALIESGDESDIKAECLDQLKNLEAVAKIRREFRASTALVNEDHFDFDYTLGENGKIESARPFARNQAHLIVEEAMVAINSCAGELLAKHNAGLHLRHEGLRDDRLGEVKALLKEESIEYPDELNELTRHVEFIKSLQTSSEHQALLAPLRRMMRGSEISTAPGSHLGMGLAHYATISSPIRRYADLYNQWRIAEILSGKPCKQTLKDSDLEQIQEALQHGRKADRELQQWLLCQYAEPLIGKEFVGKVRVVTQQGFGLKLIDSGIEGFVLLPKKQEKQFDAKRMTIRFNGLMYKLDDEVKVKLAAVQTDKRKIALELVSR